MNDDASQDQPDLVDIDDEELVPANAHVTISESVDDEGRPRWIAYTRPVTPHPVYDGYDAKATKTDVVAGDLEQAYNLESWGLHAQARKYRTRAQQLLRESGLRRCQSRYRAASTRNVVRVRRGGGRPRSSTVRSSARSGDSPGEPPGSSQPPRWRRNPQVARLVNARSRRRPS